jgi:hypothetical protein
MELTLCVLVDLVITATIVTHQILPIPKRFTRISFIVPIIGIVVVSSQSPNLTISLTGNTDVNGVDNIYYKRIEGEQQNVCIYSK